MDQVTAPMPDRRFFLGGSDAAAVMGLSPWATPLELWRAKTGRADIAPPDPAQAKRWARGHKLEPFIREMTIDRLRDDYGMTVDLVACNARYTDPEHPFMSCEIDFELVLTGTMPIGDELVAFDRERINVDAKSVSGFARRKWGREENTEDVPIEYAAQFMFGLMVTPGRRKYTLVAALRSFDDVDLYWTVRDDETIAAMRPKLVSFWCDHVLADVPPDPMVFDDIKLLFPIDNGAAIEATPEIADKAAQFRDVKARIKDFEKAEEALEFELAEYISPHARLTYGGRDLLTWKGQNDTRLDSTLLKSERPDLFAEFARSKIVRVLRIVKPKKGE